MTATQVILTLSGSYVVAAAVRYPSQHPPIGTGLRVQVSYNFTLPFEETVQSSGLT